MAEEDDRKPKELSDQRVGRVVQPKGGLGIGMRLRDSASGKAWATQVAHRSAMDVTDGMRGDA